MFDIKALIRAEAPGDMAIGVVRDALYHEPEWVKLKSHYPKARVLFRYKDGGQELPDSTTVAELQAGMNAGTMSIAIDDGAGGQLEEV